MSNSNSTPYTENIIGFYESIHSDFLYQKSRKREARRDIKKLKKTISKLVQENLKMEEIVNSIREELPAELLSKFKNKLDKCMHSTDNECIICCENMNNHFLCNCGVKMHYNCLFKSNNNDKVNLKCPYCTKDIHVEENVGIEFECSDDDDEIYSTDEELDIDGLEELMVNDMPEIQEMPEIPDQSVVNDDG